MNCTKLKHLVLLPLLAAAIILPIAVCALVGVGRPLGGMAAAEKTDGRDAVFEMREVSAFLLPFSPHLATRGQFAQCSTEPDRAVKAYPKLKSKRPLYGKLAFDLDMAHGKSVEYQFVLDESGEAPAAEKDKEPSKTEKTKPLKAEARLSRYDRLCVDLNRDLDLTNDPVLKLMKDPPWKALPPWEVRERAAYDYLDIPVDYGPGIGVRPFRVLPWLTVNETENHTYWTMHFVATVARHGRIRLAGRQYDAFLAQPYNLSGRFDRPWTALLSKPLNSKEQLESNGFVGDMLMTVQRVGGELFTFHATPLGDKLTVKPYRGDFGLFTIGPGGRDVKPISFNGARQSETMALSLQTEPAAPRQKPEQARQCRVPVGDYLPSWLSIAYGRLSIQLSDNYHSEGAPMDVSLGRHPLSFFVKIRKDKPFVLDFSHKPAVLFTSPAKEKTFHPGDEVSVKAVLIDPVYDIMIRRLHDTSRKKDVTIKYFEGKKAKERSYEEPFSLDPVVTISDASGKKLAEGPMPFG
jgi:hypothetical protein